MIDEVEIVFNYGDICDESTSKLGLSRVKQLLVTGPFGKYYIVDGDDGIRAILCLLCEKFKVINFFFVEESELTVFAQNIMQYSESCFVDVEVGTDCEHSGEECDYEWTEASSKERGRIVGDRDGKIEGFKIKTFINKHTCEEAFFNSRADTVTLAQYFKNKL
ncbi:hypothetical protein H5410_014829 [Solanum commersonii]|uniref:Uncharacterized protein n=1 Tax=Solanum commersonii TaxID=4109 RepID=A0A9J5ZRY1_SOLCO|nr:hypothetical protein H5410_014829 [Solanum commersonii]